MPMGSGSGEGRRAGAEARGYGGGNRDRDRMIRGSPVQTRYAGPPNMQDLATRGMKKTTAGARDALTGAGPILNGLRALAPVKSMSLTDLIQQMTGYMGTAPTMNQGRGPGPQNGLMATMSAQGAPGLPQGVGLNAGQPPTVPPTTFPGRPGFTLADLYAQGGAGSPFGMRFGQTRGLNPYRLGSKPVPIG